MVDLYLLRPGALWLLLLIPALLWLWRRGQQGGSGWETLIPSPLLAPLMPAGAGSGRKRSTGWWLVILLVITTVALAGPSWRKAPNPLEKLPDSLVVALDLSLSMLATDELPDRLTRAKQKIRDLLPERADAFTGLVAFAGEAHVVTPLTDDRRAIENLLPALDPFMMPALGSRGDRGIQTAIELLEQGGRGTGSILLITDGLDQRHHQGVRALLAESGYGLQILAVGTPGGAPIPIPERGFLRDQGELVTPQLNMDELNSLASITDARIARLTLTNDDLDHLNTRGVRGSAADASVIERRLNLRVDDGYWLIWLLLPLGLLAWRRGGLAVVLLAVTLPLSEPAHALALKDLWLRGDQQGARLFSQDPEAAAKAFTNPAWRGAALYRAGDYTEAAKAFSQVEGTNAAYNRGNALARSGELEAAIEAYDAVLEAEPGHDDARANRELVKALLEEQEQEQEQQQQNQQGEDGDEDKSESTQQQDGDNGKGQNQPSDPGNSEESQAGEAGTESEPARVEPPESTPENESQTDAEDPQDDGLSDQGLLSDPAAQDERSREQWMRRVPDDPGGLLRRKFLYQYQQNNPGSEESQPW